MNTFIIEAALKNAFIEDNHYIDVTSDMLIEKHLQATGLMTSKADGIICGTEVVDQAFLLLDPSAKITWYVGEGEAVVVGQELMKVDGDARALLKAERIALNFMQRMCGIATMTKSFVEALDNPLVKLVDTRKTTPLFRPFEKYSVFIGGACNHRYNLSDAVMIKDNHILVCGGIRQAVDKARKMLGHTIKIEVEVESLDQLKEAIEANADIIMLDNMSTEMIREAVAINAKRAILEVSGNVTIDRLNELGKTGIDVISSGALTHSYPVMDISFNIILD
ncbi:carboxylating nicotinate-nucleotide diphosphorylase [Fusibacter sp. A1]|nr:carboxylating nicotinate-nucleotide diphosphorylase [Fusibacter sp. A1]RXV62612.1 carboxylating nicotinate-nucleotide diphosphorylase [Fusibacter sp. A1]